MTGNLTNTAKLQANIKQTKKALSLEPFRLIVRYWLDQNQTLEKQAPDQVNPAENDTGRQNSKNDKQYLTSRLAVHSCRNTNENFGEPVYARDKEQQDLNKTR